MADAVKAPPRVNLASSRTTKQHLTPIQILLQMGFNKHRAEKALAATGDRGAQIAADWLLAHVNDPTLDTSKPREYILYACPDGDLANDLVKFWDSSLNQCGRNGAHNYVPHITLVSFFKAPDECSLQLSQALSQIIEQELEKHGSVYEFPLELYTSPNFMGYFVCEESSSLLKKIALQYVKEVSDAIINDNYEQLDAIAACFPWCTNANNKLSMLPRGIQSISLEPHVKSLHLTLAYQFAATQYECLKKLVESTFPSNQSTTWEIRLYSRDARLAGKHVYKVVYSHVPREPDELELRIGDFVYVTEGALDSSPDGWVEGISWLTGCSGYFPVNYVERTAETDAWTLHRSIPFSSSGALGKDIQGKLSQELFSSDITSNNDKSNEGKNGIFVMRHGERIDFTFGQWISHCFTPNGEYIRRDLNLPLSVPLRNNSPDSFSRDSPITNVGLLQGKLLGEALRISNTEIHRVYCSPALRSIQTCTAFLQGLGIEKNIEINIEPALYEWLQWYHNELPQWMTLEELSDAGYNVNKNYAPMISEDRMKKMLNESLADYYERSYEFVEKVIQELPKDGENVLLVGHAATLDTCSRQLIGRSPRDLEQLERLLFKVPYCALVKIEQDDSKWFLTDIPVSSITSSTNKRFDWNVLND